MTRVEVAVSRGARWIAPIGAALACCVLAGAALAALTKPTTVTTHQTKRGKDLAAANGHALYLFTSDTGATSKCYGSCANTWKPLLTSGRPIAASRLAAAAGSVSQIRLPSQTDNCITWTALAFRSHS